MRFSVMIPTRHPGNPRRMTLVSVLRQALPAAEVEIAVVNDHSIMADVRGSISSPPYGSRIEFHPSGGYRAHFRKAVDVEMWVRIAASYQARYEPRVLAACRRHGGSNSSRLGVQGAVWRDPSRAIMSNACSLPESIRKDGVNRIAR